MSAPRMATNDGPRRTLRIAARTFIGSVIALALLVGVTTGSMAAAPRRTAQNRAAYCKLLSSFNKKENAARTIYSSVTSPVPLMKSVYKALNTVAAHVLHVAPPALKGTYAKEVNSLHQVYSDLAKVNFDYLSLPESEIMTFESIQSSVSAETKRIATYDKKFCSAKG